MYKKPHWTSFSTMVSLVFTFSFTCWYRVFRCLDISGSYISIRILSVRCTRKISSEQFKDLFQGIQPENLLTSKSSKYSLLKDFEIILSSKTVSVLSFDWPELFCLIHSASFNSVLDICLNTIHCWSKSLLQTDCDCSVVAFAFTFSLEHTGRCWKVLFYVYHHFFPHTCNSSTYIYIWVYMSSFLLLFAHWTSKNININNGDCLEISQQSKLTFLIKILCLSVCD